MDLIPQGEKKQETEKAINEAESTLGSKKLPTITLYLCVFVCFFEVFVSVAVAQQVNVQDSFSKFHVSVKIDKTEDTSKRIQSYITRELRQLPDVQVVYSKPEWELNIIAGTLKIDKYVYGYVISVIMVKAFDSNIITNLNPCKEKQWINNQWVNNIEALFSNKIYELGNHLLFWGPLKSLKDQCKEIVAIFDTKHLARERKARQSILDLVDKDK